MITVEQYRRNPATTVAVTNGIVFATWLHSSPPELLATSRSEVVARELFGNEM